MERSDKDKVVAKSDLPQTIKTE